MSSTNETSTTMENNAIKDINNTTSEDFSNTLGLDYIDFCNSENFTKLFNLKLEKHKMYRSIAEISCIDRNFPQYYDIDSFIWALDYYIERLLFDIGTEDSKNQANIIIEAIQQAFN